jgi:ribosome maturation factor RimP
MRQDPKLKQILTTVVEAMGYEWVGVEFYPHRAAALLRVYIDSEEGIKIADCQRVSEQLSATLDVENPIARSYSLEVSSPGLDRPLFEVNHFIRFAGHKVRIQLSEPLNGRRNFTGQLRGVRDDNVVLESEGQELQIPLERIENARLVPEF